MAAVLYSIIILVACTVGALLGIGGGIIIKPLLDFIGLHSVETVSFISSCAVFAMSISSSVRHIVSKTPMDKRIVGFVAFGSVFGGILGNMVFDAVFARFNADIVKGVQAVIICAFILFVLVYVNAKSVKSLKITQPLVIMLTGLLLGMTSAFLGIGGGPINTAFLVLLFSFTVKESAVYSVAIIFFSQLSQLLTIFINNRFAPYQAYFPLVLCAMAAAVLGGLLGSKLNKTLSNRTITKVFTIVLSLVAVINVYNAVRGFTA